MYTIRAFQSLFWWWQGYSFICLSRIDRHRQRVNYEFTCIECDMKDETQWCFSSSNDLHHPQRVFSRRWKLPEKKLSKFHHSRGVFKSYNQMNRIQSDILWKLIWSFEGEASSHASQTFNEKRHKETYGYPEWFVWFFIVLLLKMEWRQLLCNLLGKS
jgi:hypothetical protein